MASVTEDRQTPRRSGRRTVEIVALVIGIVLVGGFVLLPLWASLNYRSAVNQLHDELATLQPASAEVVDEYVDSCWQRQAPASIRVLQPIAGAEVSDVKADYIAQLESKGFSSGSLGPSPVQGRERDDGLDGDLVRFEIDESTNTVTVIADTYDTDSVYCLPFG